MKIESYSFGRMQIDGITYRRDLRLAGTRILPDWWRRSGHVCAPQDIEDLLDPNVRILVLGMGKPGLMRASSSLRELLAERGIRLIEEPTEKAIQNWNRLIRERDPDQVVAGFHLTC